MQSKRANFEVDNYRLVNESSESQFATLEVDVCRSGENSHRMAISHRAIEECASSIKGKPVLAAFQFADVDFGGHDFDEQPVGFFIEEEPEIVEKEYAGKTEKFIRAKAKVWKRYFENAMDIFKRKQGRSDVSMEIDMLDFREPEGSEDGYINLFSILGCTLLGVTPAIQGSEARVLSFSEIKDEYDKESQGSELERFTSARRNKMAEVSYKINKTELKETPWGDVDKTAMRNKIMKAINKATLVKSVYALVEDGWQDSPSEHLKYPIMQLVGDTFYYNRYALSSALAYAKQENETTVINKIEKLYKKFKLDENEGGDDKNMAEIKKNMEAEEVMEDVKCADEEVMQEEEVMADEEAMAEDTLKNSDESEEMADEAEEMCDKMSDEESETFTDDQEEVEKADQDDEPDDDDAKGSDERAEEFTDEAEEMADEADAEMALDENNYAGAMLEMLRAEDDEQRQAARELGLSDDDKMNVIMEECYSIACELSELRKFRKDTIDEKTAFEVSQVLASVKQDLSVDKYAELETKAKECSYEDLEQFKLMAKAFAYENGTTRKAKKQDTHIKMGYDFGIEVKRDGNVFAQILSK